MTLPWVATLLLLAAQNPAPAGVLTFHFERIGLPVPLFTLTVNADGTGTYVASVAPTPSRYATISQETLPNTPVQAPITLTPVATGRLFDQLRATHHLKSCSSKAKNIADSGTKVITYTGPDGDASCTFNYSEDKQVAAMTATFQAIATTLDLGRSLDTAHRFDRLGLDQQMTILVSAVKDGRAVELGNIAPTLRSLADDQQVLERVRTTAAKLLEQSTVTP